MNYYRIFFYNNLKQNLEQNPDKLNEDGKAINVG